MKPAYIKSLAAVTLGTLALAACDNDLAYPPVITPGADVTMVPNTTIAQLKETYWDMPADGITVGYSWYAPIGADPLTGDSLIISGTILSSDEEGNIYKNLIIRCDRGSQEAITFSIDKGTLDDALYVGHKFGQRVIVNVTGLAIGKYSNYMEIGAPSSQYGIGYLPREEWNSRAAIVGMPDPDVEAFPVTIQELQEAKKTPEGLRKWQSQYVEITDATFLDGGKATFGDNGSWGDRYITDGTSGRLNVRCSGKSNFAYTTLPTGSGTIRGILGYYNSDWQMLLNGIDSERDLVGFTWENTEDPDTPDVPIEGSGNGSAEAPYTADQLAAATSTTGVWFTGYIVGAIDGSGKSISEESKFEAPFTIATNILVGAAADVKDYNQCIPVQLPSGAIRSALNLVDNPSNLGKQVSIKGNIERYFGVTGFKSASAYAWGDKGQESSEPEPEPGTPSGTLSFSLATSLSAGSIILVTPDGQVAIPIAADRSYGYLYAEDATEKDGVITTNAANAITLEASGDQYTLKDCYGRYLSMDATHASFQLYDTAQEGSLWDVTLASDGHVSITNHSRPTFTIRWLVTSSYQDFNVSEDTSAPLPLLYCGAAK